MRSGRPSAWTPRKPGATIWQRWSGRSSPPQLCPSWAPCCATTRAGGTWPTTTTPIVNAEPLATLPTPPSLTATPQTTQRMARVRLGLVLGVAVLAAGVAGLGYLVSFEAISNFVVRIGALPENLRWCGPLLVDTFITIATLFLVWLALSGVQLRHCWDAYYAWTLIAVATIASAYLNAAHVQPSIGPDAMAAKVRWDARIAAGAVPFAVLASVHLLVLLLLRLLAWSPGPDAVVSTADPEELPRADQPPIAPPTPAAEPRRDAKNTRHAGVRALLAEETREKPVTWQDVQAATGLSRSRSYALLRWERETLAGTNGQHET